MNKDFGAGGEAILGKEMVRDINSYGSGTV